MGQAAFYFAATYYDINHNRFIISYIDSILTYYKYYYINACAISNK